MNLSTSSDDAGSEEVAPAEQAASKAQLSLVSNAEATHAASPKQSNLPSHDKLKALQYQYLATRQATLLQAVALFLDQKDLAQSLIATCESMHNTFNCTRVVAGLIRNDEFNIVHISQQSSFDSRSGEAQLLTDAMQEACDQDQLIHFSVGIDADDSELTIVESHRAVLSGIRNGQICTIPLAANDELIGAIMLEAHDIDRWSPLTTELQLQIAQSLSPMIAMRQQSETSGFGRIKSDLHTQLAKWLSPRHLALKLSLATTALVLLLAAFIPVTHHVHTSAELISSERRLITSPILGYVEKVHVNVGDTVVAGQALLDLDVRDLELQAEQQSLHIESAESEYRAAMAGHDRNEMAVVQAQLDQLRAELALTASQIDRSKLIAPVDGMIVSGELSQIIGAPVELGSTLLEMAPASDYEIQLSVNEADISRVHSGQIGNLTLKSNPFQPIEFSIDSVHPIAVATQGSTRFNVTAKPNSTVHGLRPGQTGVAKLEAGSASLLWTWTHRLTAWLKIKLWSWF